MGFLISDRGDMLDTFEMGCLKQHCDRRNNRCEELDVPKARCHNP